MNDTTAFTNHECPTLHSAPGNVASPDVTKLDEIQFYDDMAEKISARHFTRHVRYARLQDATIHNHKFKITYLLANVKIKCNKTAGVACGKSPALYPAELNPT